MCGVLGYISDRIDPFTASKIQSLFTQSKIRGQHATGVTWYDFSDNTIQTKSGPVPADQFEIPFDEILKDERHVALIGHTRYSTSDLEWNQPISRGDISIVHNGVVTQESPETWKEHFGYDCQGKNDSELLLCSIENNKQPITEFSESSISMLALIQGNLLFCRNGKRPLNFYTSPNEIVIASTSDILLRSGFVGYPTTECLMDTVYSLPVRGPIFSLYQESIPTGNKDLQYELSN